MSVRLGRKSAEYSGELGSNSGEPPHAAVGCPVEVRRASGAGPVAVRGSGLKFLRFNLNLTRQP